jgi:hypothetical protein
MTAASRLLVTFMVFASAWSLHAAELALTQSGQPKAIIVLSPTVRAGAPSVVALVSHIRQMSGATLPVMAEGDLGAVKVDDGRIAPSNGNLSDKTFILLGEGELTRQLKLSLEGIGAGGVVLKSGVNFVALLERDDGSNGKRKDATAHVVFNFLEALGCRCLWPGEIGKVVPQRKTVTVGELDVRFTPSIGQRNIRFTTGRIRGLDRGLESLGFTPDDYQKAMAGAMKVESQSDWSAWNGLGGNLGILGGAAGGGLRGGWAEQGKEHPEWFALQPDGTRDQSKAKERWRLCVSDPGLIEHVANDIIARLQGHAQNAISLCPNDGGYSSFCMCDACRALDPPNGAKIKMLMFAHVGSAERTEINYVSLSDRYVHYWNAIAERVTKVVPDQLFLVEAYSVYSDPPVREKLHPNLVLRYVPDNAEGWKGWQSAGAQRVYWRPNNLHHGYRDGMLSPRAREDSATLSYLAAHGMLATDMDSIYNNWATQGLHYYAMARLSWDPKQEFDAILDDYCKTGFGAGAEQVKKYFLMAEKGIVQTTGKYAPPQVTPETVDQLRDALVAAAKATEGDAPSHRRVSFLRAGLEFTAVSAEAHRLADEIEQGKKIDRQAVNAVMERRWQMMRALLQSYPLAVNVGVVAANDTLLTRALNWKGPSEGAKSSKLELKPDDNWLNEDQSATRR